jgi:hypothetical protein
MDFDRSKILRDYETAAKINRQFLLVAYLKRDSLGESGGTEGVDVD